MNFLVHGDWPGLFAASDYQSFARARCKCLPNLSLLLWLLVLLSSWAFVVFVQSVDCILIINTRGSYKCGLMRR